LCNTLLPAPKTRWSALEPQHPGALRLATTLGVVLQRTNRRLYCSQAGHHARTPAGREGMTRVIPGLVTVLVMLAQASPGGVRHAHAGEADVVAVSATRTGEHTWRFDVTVQSPDRGRDDYADGWQVVAPDGAVLGTRELAHPHVDEQPFMRSLHGVEIPEDVARVTVRARMKEGGYGGREMTVELQR